MVVVRSCQSSSGQERVERHILQIEEWSMSQLSWVFELNDFQGVHVYTPGIYHAGMSPDIELIRGAYIGHIETKLYQYVERNPPNSE